MTVAILTLTGNVTGGPDGARTIGPFSSINNSSVSETHTVALASGANTITVPSAAQWCVIHPQNAVAPGQPAPNPASTVALTLKGVSGDTGVAISNYNRTVLDWSVAPQGSAPSPPANFVISASGSGASIIVEFG